MNDKKRIWIFSVEKVSASSTHWHFPCTNLHLLFALFAFFKLHVESLAHKSLQQKMTLEVFLRASIYVQTSHYE